MGKPHNRKKKRNKSYQNSAKPAIQPSHLDTTSTSKSPDVRLVDALLAQAEAYVNNFEYDRALECCRSALDQDPDHLQALDLLSAAALELGDVQTAKCALLHAVELSPDVGHTKYLCLGQSTEGAEALRYYQRGADIIRTTLDGASNVETEKDEQKSLLRKELSRAYCAMAEIYMTDCCFEEDAEARCRDLVSLGLQADPSNPEAFQCRANFLVTTGETEHAKEAMEHSLSLWLPHYRTLREGEADAGGAEACLPEYDARIAAAKLLVELEMYGEATEVLEGLVEEDDEHPVAWYLLGWSNYLHGEEYRESARHYLTQTKQVAAKVRFDDPEILGHIDELLAELGPEDNDEGSVDGEASDNFDTDDEEEQIDQ